MPSLKKKTEAAGPQTPFWHPNFRNYEALPDTKVVRTAFFVNGGAIAVAVALLIYFTLGEFQLSGLRGQIDDLKTRIETDKPANDQAIAKYKKFKEEEAKILEIDAFVKSRPRISVLINDLSRTLPVNVAIDTFDLRADGITLRGTVRGSPDKASGYASAYVDMLRSTPEFGQLFSEITLTNLSRVPATGRVAIEVMIKLAPKEKK